MLAVWCRWSPSGWLEWGRGGRFAFIGVYVVGDLVLIPGSVLSLAGGALFGFIRGTLLVFLASTLGAVAAFLVARYIARRYVQRCIGAGRLAAIDRAIARKGFRLVLLLRLSPVVPYSLLNYALGLTRVRFRDFLLGSVGMLPGTILYVHYGKVAGEVAALAGGRRTPHDVAYWILVAVGLAASVFGAVRPFHPAHLTPCTAGRSRWSGRHRVAASGRLP